MILTIFAKGYVLNKNKWFCAKQDNLPNSAYTIIGKNVSKLQMNFDEITRFWHKENALT